MFKDYLDKLISNKKSLVAGILCVPVIFFNCTSESWLSNGVQEKLEEKDNNKNRQEMQFESSNDVDEAYDFIMQNIDLTAADGVSVEIIKGENSIIVVYTYDEELTQILKQQGLSEDDIFEIISQAASTSLEIKQWVKDYAGINIDIETKIYDSEGHLYAHSINDELIEMNPVSPTNKYEEPVEKQQPKQEEQGKDPMEESNGRHMESTAPYGRCPRCNAANASDKSYQGNYCDDCYAQIKEEEYAEKHQYGDCIDCGVYLTKNQAESYGGRCPDCYAKHYGDNDTHMGTCDRCGDRVDLDHTNEGWGYQHLCSACTGELQAEESAQDASPYAG